MDDFGAWSEANFTTTVMDNWTKGIPDFLPYSLITNSTFANLMAHDSVISLNDALVEIRSTIFDNNNCTGKDSSTLKASGGTLVLRENVTFSDNVGDSGGAISLLKKSKLRAHGTQFLNNTANKFGGVLMLREATSVVLKNVNFESNTAKQVGSAIWASNGGKVTTITVTDSSFQNNFAY